MAVSNSFPDLADPEAGWLSVCWQYSDKNSKVCQARESPTTPDNGLHRFRVQFRR